MKDHYADYSVDDFLQDSYFYEWVRFSSPEHQAFWQSWLIRHPEKKETVQQARYLLKSIINKEKQPPPHFKTEDWAEIQRRIAAEAPLKVIHTQPSHPAHSFKLWAAAASVFLVLGISIFLYLNSNSSSEWITVKTPYGEQQSITLPDQSEVILNGNSKLRYLANWAGPAVNREVWLEGEGFFSVAKQPIYDNSHTKKLTKFIVHASGLNVEVRGTQFNVQSRTEKTRVVLSEGEVLVHNEQQDSILLKPNELAESDANYGGIRKKTVDAQQFISWKDQMLIFSEEPVVNILNQLENTYGWQIDVQDSSWLQQRYTGSVPTDRIELLFEKFSLLYELDTEYRNRKVTIR